MTALLIRTAGYRPLFEQSLAAGPKLKIDEDRGIIFGVRVLGRYSPNNRHGSTDGSEYPPTTQRAALPLIEGAQVKLDHPADRTRPNVPRDCDETLGVLRNAIVEGDETRADLHYYTTHPLAKRVVEDVRKGLGQCGLSINAIVGEGKVINGVFVVEEIAEVRSVDLVDRPATNKNLWESIEGRRPPAHDYARDSFGYATRAIRSVMESADGRPAGSLTDGFDAECSNVLKAFLDGTTDAVAALKRLRELFAAHDKLIIRPSTPDVDPADTEVDPSPVAAEESRDHVPARRPGAALACLHLCESIGYRPAPAELTVLMETKPGRDRRQRAVAFKDLSRDSFGRVVRALPRGAGGEYANDSFGRATRGR